MPLAIAPLTAAGQIDQKDVLAVQLRNAGTSTVKLWNGLYTLDPKETLSVNVTESGFTMDLQAISVTFDNTTGSVNRLEIILLRYVRC